MNLEYYNKLVSEPPVDVAHSYIFIVSRRDLAINIIAAGYNSLYIGNDGDSVDDLIEYMNANEYRGLYINDYKYVTYLRKSDNDKLTEYLKCQYHDYVEGYWLFNKKEYLEKSEYEEELKGIIGEFIARFEGTEDGRKNLDRYHRFNEKGKPVGTFDIRIVESILNTVPFILLNGVAYVYENGVYKEDKDCIILRTKITEYIYPELIKSAVISAVLSLLLTQPGLIKQFYEINNHPKHWINFKNGWLDAKTLTMHPHNPQYLSINQIPYEFDTKWLGDIPDGENVQRYLSSSVPDEDNQLMMWEYLGYCMSADTSFQKFLMIKGRGGTGKSILVSIFQKVVGIDNASSISLQSLNQRFYATGLFGKLLNACADIPATALENVDVIKKAVGEDTLLYERKGADATQFTSYAKLLFSANELPLNLDEKSNAYYRRLMILNMNQAIPDKDKHLKDKLYAEMPYILTMSVKSLNRLYEDGTFKESDESRECVESLHRSADSVKAFLDECVEQDEAGNVGRREMYEAYTEFCKREERSEHKKSIFFKYMEDKGYPAKRTANGFVYEGMKLINDGFIDITEDDELMQGCPFI